MLSHYLHTFIAALLVIFLCFDGTNLINAGLPSLSLCIASLKEDRFRDLSCLYCQYVIVGLIEERRPTGGWDVMTWIMQ